MYDTKTWTRNQRGGQPIRRPGSNRTPCKSCPKCKDEKEATPTTGKQNTLNNRNQATLQRYYEHQAVGGTVSDPITRKHFGIIQQMLDTYQRSHSRALIEMMAVRPPW